MSKRHHGSSLDSLLKEAVVWQLTEAMAKQSLSKARLAALLNELV